MSKCRVQDLDRKCNSHTFHCMIWMDRYECWFPSSSRRKRLCMKNLVTGRVPWCVLQWSSVCKAKRTLTLWWMKWFFKKGNIRSYYYAKIVARSTMMLHIWALIMSKLYDWRVLLEQHSYSNVDNFRKEWAQYIKLSITKGAR